MSIVHRVVLLFQTVWSQSLMLLLEKVTFFILPAYLELLAVFRKLGRMWTNRNNDEHNRTRLEHQDMPHLLRMLLTTSQLSLCSFLV